MHASERLMGNLQSVFMKVFLEFLKRVLLFYDRVRLAMNSENKLRV